MDSHSITFECMMSGTKRDASAGLDPEGCMMGFYLENFFWGGSLNSVYGLYGRSAKKGCMERCIMDPFHIKMHFMNFGSNRTNR